mmetsp:Transcript_12322/g.18156  ORF Transcript_12322/g.18156 Transcript_12322/m.18156 type:complete len:286 (-) Transcript_12322:278-1135(-)
MYSQPGSAPSSNQGAGGSQYQQDPMYTGWTAGVAADGSMNQEVLNMGVKAGQNFVQSSLAKYAPGVHLFWFTLKFYFAVNNRFVVQKLRVLMFPFKHPSWERIPVEDVQTLNPPHEQPSNNTADHPPEGSHKWAKPWADPNCPDLYIPLMAFITFALTNGYLKGQANQFTPEVLTDVTTNCMLVEVMQVLLMRLGLYLLSAPASILDLLAYSAYKYTGLCVAQVLEIVLGTWAYYAALTYLAAALGYFMMRTMAHNIPAGGSQREIIVIGLAALQFLVTWFLGFM